MLTNSGSRRKPEKKTSRTLSSMTVCVTAAVASLGLATPAGAVVGGERASTSDYPWVMRVDNGNKIGCGGTLVAPTKVLTAAHCITTAEPGATFKVIAGEDRYDGTGGDRVAVTGYWVHPHAENPPAGQPRVDLAVLTLARPLSQQPLLIAAPHDADLYRTGRTGIALGWGADSEHGTPPSEWLRQATIPVTTPEECSKWFPNESGKSAFCAGGNGKGVALGDSGGPLVIGGKLAGVVSGGASSEYGKLPAKFTDISKFSDQLAQQIRS
ncbi:S1 family peptidase [Streptomyces sp. NPDC004296]|uniref:S1 family peptidase n=1 Tax=Streptomyces sp. NPDC004296 TaxID=3364697 RepID=UPI0036C3745B